MEKAGISAVPSPEWRQRQVEIKCSGGGAPWPEKRPQVCGGETGEREGFLEEADVLVSDQSALCFTR